MKVKFGGGIVDARGSVAGNTFSRNHYGAFVRARVTPINPNTALQIAVHSALAFVSDRWANTLTALQRTAWNLYGSSVAMTDKLGATMYLTGYNHYIRSNVALARAGISTIDAAPVLFELPAHDPLLSFTASQAMGQATVTFDDGFAWCSEDDAYMEIYGGKPQNAQRGYFDGPWRICGMFVGDSGVPIVSPQVLAYQFSIAEGQHLWIYARIRRADGRLSQRFQADTFCDA